MDRELTVYATKNGDVGTSSIKEYSGISHGRLVGSVSSVPRHVLGFAGFETEPHMGTYRPHSRIV